jgi:hypothetical protein
MPEKKIEEAKAAYETLVQKENHLRAQNRIMVALPKKKLKLHKKLLATCLMNYRNAQATFQNAVKELTPEQFSILHKQVYV